MECRTDISRCTVEYGSPIISRPEGSLWTRKEREALRERKKIQFFGVIALVVALAIVIAGCAQQETKTDEGKKTSEYETITAGVLTVGSDIAFPPFESKDENTGEIIGFDIDLAAEIADRLGLELEIVPALFDSIIPALNGKKFDLVISAMTITEKREEEVDFSDPYINSNQSIAVAADSDIDAVEGLSGKIVGVQRGTTGADKAEELKDEVGITEIRTYEDALLAFEDLKAGRVDAIINDLPVSAFLATKDPAFKVVAEIKTDEQYGMAFRDDNDTLREAVNKILKEMRDDGTYDRIYAKWFGETP